MAILRKGLAISGKILDDWMAVKNGVAYPESALFSARWNRLERLQNRHIILSIAVKV